MKRLKVVGMWIFENVGEICVAALILLQIATIIAGEYEVALFGSVLAMNMAMAVLFQKRAEKYRQAYRELWSKLVVFYEMAQEEGRKLVVKYDGVDTINLEREGEQPKVLPSEALYGFAAWLTTRDEAITLGSTHDASVVADVVKQYCEAQGYENPRDDHYPKNIVAMGGTQTWHATAQTSEPEEGKKP